MILDPTTVGLDEVLERRRRSGLDRLDEVWEGVYHMVPAPSGGHAHIAQQLAELLGPAARAAGLFPMIGQFNLGESEHDYRVPDGGIHRTRAFGVWHRTAALVVEIVSPADESWEKLPFYAAHGVDEIMIADPLHRAVSWLALEQGEYREIESSRLIDLGARKLQDQLDWPEIDSAG